MALTPEEEKELAKLEKEVGSLTPEEQIELAALEQEFGGEKKEPGLAMKTLSGIAKGLDYAGGVTRAGVANVADAFVPGEIATKEDLLNALKANPPSTEDYLKRAGVPEGYSLSDALSGMYSEAGDGLKFKKGGALDPTVRGLSGFVGDTALDPLTYLSLGSSAAAKSGAKAATRADQLINPVSAALRGSGEKVYKSGLKRIDQETAKFGKEPVSDVLMKYGITGSADTIYNKMDDLAGKLKSEADLIIKEAADKGATVSMRDAMKLAQDRVLAMRTTRDPKLAPVADSLDSELKKYFKLDPSDSSGLFPTQKPVSVNDANIYKQSIYKDMPKNAYQEMLSGKSPAYLAGEKDMARGLKEGVEASVDKATGRGSELTQLNDELGRLLTSGEKQRLEAVKEANKNAITSVDAPLFFASPGASIAKKAADIAKMTGPRTVSGKAMKDLGKKNKGALDILSRRSFWELMNEPQEENYVERDGI